MKWQVVTNRAAAKDIHRLATRDRNRILEAVTDMAMDPFSGDVTRLKGRSQRLEFRRRVGSWRIIFGVDYDESTVVVFRVVRRTTRTYKR